MVGEASRDTPRDCLVVVVVVVVGAVEETGLFEIIYDRPFCLLKVSVGRSVGRTDGRTVSGVLR